MERQSITRINNGIVKCARRACTIWQNDISTAGRSVTRLRWHNECVPFTSSKTHIHIAQCHAIQRHASERVAVFLCNRRRDCTAHNLIIVFISIKMHLLKSTKWESGKKQTAWCICEQCTNMESKTENKNNSTKRNIVCECNHHRNV